VLPVVGGTGAYVGASGILVTEIGRKKTVLRSELQP
jgi:hypothetical protein